jgi:hypothetical protein
VTVKVGETIHKLNDNKTVYTGTVLTIFQTLDGSWMYVAQRPHDRMMFVGNVPIREKELPSVTYGQGKY